MPKYQHYKIPDKTHANLQRKQAQYEMKHLIKQQPLIISTLSRDDKDLTLYQGILLLLAVSMVIREIMLSQNAWQLVSKRGENGLCTPHSKHNPEYKVSAFNITQQYSLFSSTMHSPSQVVNRPSQDITYKGLLAEDISLKIRDCTSKPAGITPGKVCYVNGKRYFLKKADSQGDSLTAINNFKLAQNLGITVPQIKFFYEKGKPGFYLASEAIAGFQTAQALKDTSFFANENQIDRDKTVAKIGEKGLVKLAVARTLFTDFNLQNWGFDKNGLVLIDLDLSPSHLSDYFSWWRTYALNANFFKLSIDNVAEMRTIYKVLLAKPPPKTHASVDMTQKKYNALLMGFINACTRVIDVYAKSPESTSRPTWKITSTLINSIYDEGQKIKNQEQDNPEEQPHTHARGAPPH